MRHAKKFRSESSDYVFWGEEIDFLTPQGCSASYATPKRLHNAQNGPIVMWFIIKLAPNKIGYTGAYFLSIRPV